MELGQYGWNRNINYYHTNTKFRINSAPPTSNYASLNLGDAPFNGITSGFFSGSSAGTLLGLNVPASYSGSLFDIQIGGATKLSLNSTKGLRVAVPITSETVQTDAAVYIGTLNGNGRVILGGAVIDWEIDVEHTNSQFRIYTPGLAYFIIDSGGRIAIAKSFGPPGNINLYIAPTATVGIPISVQGASGQTADLQQWQNSAGTVLSRISSTGLLSINAQAFTSLTAAYSYT